MHSDVLVVGGGPAGLAVAIAARAKGFSVSLVDSRRPPIDKPCGEGLLPEAAASLRTLGVDLESCANYRFTGVRFSDSASSASARFGRASAYGVRRTLLHRLLVQRAQSAGVDLHWGARLVHHDSLAADVDGQRIFFRWLIAADGMNSPIRKSAGLNPIARGRGRFAFRRHFSVAPWTDLVEVHWGADCQMIVTPTGPEEVCLALFTRDHRQRIDSALGQFPGLARRLAGARPASAESGARTALSKARFVARGNIALVGDASCSLDGIAGQGLNLAFHAAGHLAAALAREDLRSYASAHRAITRTPVRITRLMLLMARYPWIRKKTLRMFAAKPALFANMMSIHAGITESDSFGLQRIFGLGWRVLRA
ncbi:MAG TPA: NAD(P)/FAD-dependent oxidoreductase [Candidatus Aquilonibacter sp.]|nr:NAD(P)/FAD-dependent oxidoreductase [Candidatus Aquilonibacter sp.]